MRFSDFAASKLVESKDLFGSYSYYDKGPEEVMDIGELMSAFRKLPVDEGAEELKHLAARTDCPLDPTMLVGSILQSLDDDPSYESYFEDDELLEHY